jgi:hypothetical protein
MRCTPSRLRIAAAMLRGTRGPESAGALIAADGFACYTPEPGRYDDE